MKNYFKRLFQTFDIFQNLSFGGVFLIFLFAVNHFQLFDSLSKSTYILVYPMYQGIILGVLGYVLLLSVLSAKRKEICIIDFMDFNGLVFSLGSFILYIYFFDPGRIIFYFFLSLLFTSCLLLRAFYYDEKSSSPVGSKIYFATLLGNLKTYIAILVGIILGFIGLTILHNIDVNKNSIMTIISIMGICMGILGGIAFESISSKRTKVTVTDRLLFVALPALAIMSIYFINHFRIRYFVLYALAFASILLIITLRAVFYYGEEPAPSKYKFNRYCEAIALRFHLTLPAIFTVVAALSILYIDITGIRKVPVPILFFIFILAAVVVMYNLIKIITNFKRKEINMADLSMFLGDLFAASLIGVLCYDFNFTKLLFVSIFSVIMLVLTVLRVNIFENGIGVVVDDNEEENPYSKYKYAEYLENRKFAFEENKEDTPVRFGYEETVLDDVFEKKNEETLFDKYKAPTLNSIMIDKFGDDGEKLINSSIKLDLYENKELKDDSIVDIKRKEFEDSINNFDNVFIDDLSVEEINLDEFVLEENIEIKTNKKIEEANDDQENDLIEDSLLEEYWDEFDEDGSIIHGFEDEYDDFF